MTEKIAVIGMGQMGSAMAARLRESNLDVVGFDVNADQRARLEKEGFRMAASIAEALKERSVVLTSLPDPKAVSEAWLGAGGIVASAAKGALCIELSTIDPHTMRSVADAAHARGIAVVDCPVSGGPLEARSGKLILIAGGDEKDIARAEPILQRLGAEWKHTGGIGTAKAVKIVKNMMTMGNVPVAAEVEGAVRSWIDECIWRREVRRANTGGLDFLEPDEIELMGRGEASELDGLFRLAAGSQHRPLQHFEIAVRVAKAAIGGRPM
jgi:3-hydroxyisobutyrate dehydrogenase